MKDEPITLPLISVGISKSTENPFPSFENNADEIRGTIAVSFKTKFIFRTAGLYDSSRIIIYIWQEK